MDKPTEYYYINMPIYICVYKYDNINSLYERQ